MNILKRIQIWLYGRWVWLTMTQEQRNIWRDLARALSKPGESRSEFKKRVFKK